MSDGALRKCRWGGTPVLHAELTGQSDCWYWVECEQCGSQSGFRPTQGEAVAEWEDNVDVCGERSESREWSG